MTSTAHSKQTIGKVWAHPGYAHRTVNQEGAGNLASSGWGQIFAFCLALSLICYLKIDAPGGTDLAVYSQIKYYEPSEWQDYRNSNFVSWYILYLLFTFTSSWSIGYSLALLDIALWSIFYLCAFRTREYNWRFAILTMFSFAGVLLSYNILRQYISVVFLMCCAMQFLNRRNFTAVFFALLAALSHFSAIFFIAVFALSWITDRLNINRWLVTGVITVGSYTFFTYFAVDKLRNSSDLGDPLFELLAYTIVCAGFVFYFVNKRLRLVEQLHVSESYAGVIKNFMVRSFLIIGVIFLTGAPIWLTNRLLLTLVFLAVCVTLSARNIESRRYMPLSPYRNILPFILLIPTALLHPGARSMLFPI